jgi:uncharacterized membrane protein YesL
LNQLSAAITVIIRSFSSWWYGWVNMLAINVVWLLCSLTLVLAAPATLGLFYAANEAAHGHGGSLSDFIEGFRAYFFRSLLWGILNVVVAALVGINLQFYTQFMEVWAAAGSMLTLILSVLWIMVQIYALPYLIEQESKQLRVALRNGLFTLLASPLYTLVLAAYLVLLIALSLSLPVLFIVGVPPLIGLLANHAVLERLETFGIRGRTLQVTEPTVEEIPPDRL